MKLNVRTLQNTTFAVTVSEQDTVLQLKEKIVAEGNAPDAGRIKLIFKGVILKDTNSLSQSEITEDSTLVMMITQVSTMKPTTVAAPTAVASKPPVAQPPADKPQAEKAVEEGESEEFKATVRNIVEMGYTDESIVSKALRLSDGNPNRAVELLESGEIFEVLEEEEDLESGGEEHSEDDDEDDAPNDENAPNPLEYLRNDPQFQQMRSIIQANPQLLPHFIEQLRQTNPDIFELISQNSHSFVRLMQEGLDDASGTEDGQPPTNIIRVTEDEKAAIERLEQLGFDRARVLEAFFACDKNEELAANFLLESMNDE